MVGLRVTLPVVMATLGGVLFLFIAKWSINCRINWLRVRIPQRVLSLPYLSYATEIFRGVFVK